eukprot:CAMPEP_0195112458 /NCGR_PEP_ID=MMETSP0448-20130528/99175_1 /TAXON_ID=66468 /ORGANISM="Heterocapsa triquestra, Strain CCMP 448" /LENGTH=45 /DNA_ID= /DNA_START= /DNA_END= /DNA_ORIENTATION=
MTVEATYLTYDACVDPRSSKQTCLQQQNATRSRRKNLARTYFKIW